MDKRRPTRLITKHLLRILLLPALVFAQVAPETATPTPRSVSVNPVERMPAGQREMMSGGRHGEAGQGSMMGGQEMTSSHGGMMGNMPTCVCPASALHGPLGIVAAIGGSVLLVSMTAVLIALTIFLMRRSRQLPAN